jgi:hypothetical protein
MHINSPAPWRLLAALLAALLACGWIGAARGQRLAASEEQLKAAFTYNLAKFVEWPPASFASPAAPLRLCVAGRGPLPGVLFELDGKNVQGRELRVQQIGNTFDPGACHIVFVAAGAEMAFRDMLKQLRESAVLTVSDTSGFVEMGGVVELVLGEGRLQFDVNLSAARKAQLRLSANLLNLARNKKGN